MIPGGRASKFKLFNGLFISRDREGLPAVIPWGKLQSQSKPFRHASEGYFILPFSIVNEYMTLNQGKIKKHPLKSGCFALTFGGERGIIDNDPIGGDPTDQFTTLFVSLIVYFHFTSFLTFKLTLIVRQSIK